MALDSMTLPTLKAEMLAEVEKQFGMIRSDGSLAPMTNGGVFLEEIKSFLSTSIDKAHEAGKVDESRPASA